MAHERNKGESSRKLDVTDDEKPLKKARYVWEVKGKYHLKETYKKKEEESPQNEPSSSENNNKCCIESFLAKTEAIMDSSEDLDHPPMESSILSEIPVTLVMPNQTKNQDYYLLEWQARQVARGFVDNTINTVLETWSNPPFNAENFIEDCENDGQVEDEGILMAIQSHGLHSNANRILEQSRMDNLENYQKESGNTDDDPIDFLNAAISVAIQKKGLSHNSSYFIK